MNAITKLYSSFRNAFNGIVLLLQTERNAKIHLILSFLATFLGFLLKISSMEWIAVIFCIGFVIALEAINTSIEKLCDFVNPDYHLNIKKIKDISAAAVLISALCAFCIGLLIFIPKLL
jgi:diacylglycerol kinase